MTYLVRNRRGRKKYKSKAFETLLALFVGGFESFLHTFTASASVFQTVWHTVAVKERNGKHFNFGVSISVCSDRRDIYRSQHSLPLSLLGPFPPGGSYKAQVPDWKNGKGPRNIFWHFLWGRDSRSRTKLIFFGFLSQLLRTSKAWTQRAYSPL